MEKSSEKSSSSPLPTPLAAVLETWLARHREHFPPEIMNRLSGRTIALDVNPPGVRLVLLGANDRLQVVGESDERADVSVSGTPLALTLAFTRGDRSGLEITGDAVLLKDLQLLLKTQPFGFLEVFEAIAGAGTAGPIVALGERLRRDWDRLTQRNAADSVFFVQEELGWLPPSGEMEALCEDLADLRDDLARLEQRVQRLTARRQAHPAGPATVTRPKPE
jgi:ubiquinone biosynthesis protein UbiJ